MLSEEDDLLPIRLVEAWAYCPRQAWYRFVGNEDPLNLAMERGLRRHETVEEPAVHLEGDAWIARQVVVAAPRLGVAGVLDEVRVMPEELAITEYKAARVAARPWLGVLLQLAVQHLALREQAADGQWRGPPLPPHERTVLRVFYADSARARAGQWSDAVERRAREAVAGCAAIFGMAVPPPGRVGVRCRACQHEPICLPNDLATLLEACR